jgi:hypothetical protein
MPSRKIRDADEARTFLAAAAKSGRPRAAWAREQGICARSLNGWRLVLEPPLARVGPGLVELVQDRQDPTVAPTTGYRIRCGVFEVEAPVAFEDHVLARLLRIVATAC